MMMMMLVMINIITIIIIIIISMLSGDFTTMSCFHLRLQVQVLQLLWSEEFSIPSSPVQRGAPSRLRKRMPKLRARVFGALVHPSRLLRALEALEALEARRGPHSSGPVMGKAAHWM